MAEIEKPTMSRYNLKPKIMKKFKQIFFLFTFCSIFAFTTKKVNSDSLKNGKIWVGITYKMAKDGASAEETAVVGAYGVLHAAMEGAVYGAVVGGPAGVVAGVVWGM